MKAVEGGRTWPFPPQQAEGGFTLAELVILIAVIGILSVMAVPSFLRYYQAATLKSGAQQFAALVNHAAELALKENGRRCAKNSNPPHVMYTPAQWRGTPRGRSRPDPARHNTPSPGR